MSFDAEDKVKMLTHMQASVIKIQLETTKEMIKFYNEKQNITY